MFPNVNSSFIRNTFFIDTVAIIVSATIGREENKSVYQFNIFFFTVIFFKKGKPNFPVPFDICYYLLCG